jgi:hypothetical protein
MAADSAVAHVAVRVPHLITSALVAGGEFAKVEGFIVLVHGYIIHASVRGVKGVKRKTFKT